MLHDIPLILYNERNTDMSVLLISNIPTFEYSISNKKTV